MYLSIQGVYYRNCPKFFIYTCKSILYVYKSINTPILKITQLLNSFDTSSGDITILSKSNDFYSNTVFINS